VLEDGVDVAAVGWQRGDVTPAYEDMPGVRPLEPRDQPQGRGLAAPARAQQGVEVAARDLQVDVVDGLDRSVGLGDVAQLNVVGRVGGSAGFRT
jgi:hypothetical protein